MNLNYTGRAIFHLSDHHCDMKNIYLYLPGWFLDGSFVFFLLFHGFSMVFSDYFIFRCDSCVCNECLKGALRVFLSTWVFMSWCHDCYTQKWTFLDKNIPKNPWSTTQIILNPSGNSHEMTLKHPRNTCEIALKHPWNTNLNIDMYFPCHNACYL